MPYFYHLKFELYPKPHLGAPEDQPPNPRVTWVPPSGTDVFDDLPAHSHLSFWSASRGVVKPEYPREDHLGTRTDLSVRQLDIGSNDRRPSGDQTAVRDKSPETNFQSTDSLRHTQSSGLSRPKADIKDWRFGQVIIETLDPAVTTRTMSGPSSQSGPSAAPALGPTYGGAGTSTKADCVPFTSKSTEVGWGIIHFYREGEESIYLGDNDAVVARETVTMADDCTTLCIPAVPAYMSPSDFLGFVGDRWRDELSHCRLVVTSKMNRYLALLKFRDSKVAVKWKREFDGTVFNSMEPQLCHVVFVKSITFETPIQSRGNDQVTALQPSSSGMSSSLRPFPPPTPNLIELPTCPVCLERMDDTNGLMTIPCSHVFHCACLQNWKGAGCPVCRFTNTTSLKVSPNDLNDPSSLPFGSPVSNLCSICDCADDLWICLICGYVGCGRYKGGHAKDHWKETAHSFALELETQYVWDYAGDMWVHRLIRDKGDGKVVELPGRRNRNGSRQEDEEEEEADVVPRAKLENIGLEYTHLITSQLESQRAYYEDMINKAVDKAAAALSAAEANAAQTTAALEKAGDVEAKLAALAVETAQMEKELGRERNKASKSDALARNLSKSLQEEKRVSEGLMKRIQHLSGESEAVKGRLDDLSKENEELKEMNRDLTMFISGQEKLKELEKEGKIEEGELEGGSASVPEKKKGKRKGKR